MKNRNQNNLYCTFRNLFKKFQSFCQIAFLIYRSHTEKQRISLQIYHNRYLNNYLLVGQLLQLQEKSTTWGHISKILNECWRAGSKRRYVEIWCSVFGGSSLSYRVPLWVPRADQSKCKCCLLYIYSSWLKISSRSKSTCWFFAFIAQYLLLLPPASKHWWSDSCEPPKCVGLYFPIFLSRLINLCLSYYKHVAISYFTLTLSGKILTEVLKFPEFPGSSSKSVFYCCPCPYQEHLPSHLVLSDTCQIERKWRGVTLPPILKNRQEERRSLQNRDFPTCPKQKEPVSFGWSRTSNEQLPI